MDQWLRDHCDTVDGHGRHHYGSSAAMVAITFGRFFGWADTGCLGPALVLSDTSEFVAPVDCGPHTPHPLDSFILHYGGLFPGAVGLRFWLLVAFRLGEHRVPRP